MEILTFLYNIFLLVLYTTVLCYAITLYVNEKKNCFCITAVMFLFYILDNTIIYMTEFIDSFSAHYDLQFMSVPAFKTVVIIVTCVCLVQLQREFLPSREFRLDIAALTLMALILLFVPMLKDSAFKVWLYYLPFQLFTFYLSFSGLRYLQQRPELLTEHPFLIHYRWIARMTLLFSLLILAEDTVVIFTIDVYTELMVKINNRSFTEDMLSIIYAFFVIKHMTAELWKRTIPQNPPEDSPEERVAPPKAQGELAGEPEPPSRVIPFVSTFSAAYPMDLDPVFYQFSQEYHLTGREQDILKILLQDKNNQEISDELFISVGTVKTHVHNIFQKADVAKRNQLLQLYDAFGKSYGSHLAQKDLQAR